MSEKRIIKKYPNRRLYDTAISSYITLEDVRKLVLDDIEVEVIDARSKDDLTHNTLLQIMVDQEEKLTPLFTTEMLQQLICIYGASSQILLRQMLEQSLELFKQQQLASLESDEKVESVSNDVIRQVSQENVNRWQTIQEKSTSTVPFDSVESDSEINN